MTVVFTDLASPEIVLNRILWRFLNEVSHPSDASNSAMPSESAMRLTFVLSIGPATGIDFV